MYIGEDRCLVLILFLPKKISNIQTGQIQPAVKKITKAGVQLSTIWGSRKEAVASIWEHISSGKVAWGPQLGIVLAIGRSLQIGPITVRSSPDCLTARFHPTQFEDGNQQQGGNQRPASLNFRIGWQSAREISDSVQFVAEVLLKSIHYNGHWPHIQRWKTRQQQQVMYFWLKEIIISRFWRSFQLLRYFSFSFHADQTIQTCSDQRPTRILNPGISHEN